VQQPVFSYLLRLTGDRSLSKDILQEVFLLIFRNLHSLHNPDLFKAWVFRIASREAFRQLKKRHKEVYEPIEGHTIADSLIETSLGAEIDERQEQLPDLLHGLSPGSRAVLLLHFQEGMKLHEIAEALDLPLGTVKSRLAYGLNALRSKIVKN
jgi:RNA polymerase sigma-70 factor, ECF subfamily